MVSLKSKLLTKKTQVTSKNSLNDILGTESNRKILVHERGSAKGAKATLFAFFAVVLHICLKISLECIGMDAT